MLSLQKSLFDFLRGQVSLEPWLGTPVRIHDQPPTEVVYPYLAFGRATSQAIGGLGPDIREHSLTLTCVSRFGGVEEAKAIADILRALLDDAALSGEGQHFVSLRVTFTDVFRAADQRTAYALVRLRAVTEILN